MTISTATGRPPTIEELAFLRDQRVGRLATVDDSGVPAVVPVCYALLTTEDGPLLVSALDEKPKRVPVRDLARVRNIEAHPLVSLVVDAYSEDWSNLAFVQVHGRAEVIEPDHPLHGPAVKELRAKYPQYEQMALEGAPIIVTDRLTAASWRSRPEESSETPLARPGEADLASLIRGRRSVRSFLTRPVPRATIERAIAAAGWAPSPHGRQPWRFTVVEAAERRAALAEAMATSWREQLELDGQAPEIVELRLAKSRERLQTAPVLVVPCLYLADLDDYPDPDRQEAERIMAIQSLGAAVQNLLLSVYASGLDAGWMCAPLFCPELVRDELGLDAALTPHALIPIGYVAKEPVRRGRLPLDALIAQWE